MGTAPSSVARQRFPTFEAVIRGLAVPELSGTFWRGPASTMQRIGKGHFGLPDFPPPTLVASLVSARSRESTDVFQGLDAIPVLLASCRSPELAPGVGQHSRFR